MKQEGKKLPASEQALASVKGSEMTEKKAELTPAQKRAATIAAKKAAAERNNVVPEMEKENVVPRIDPTEVIQVPDDKLPTLSVEEAPEEVPPTPSSWVKCKELSDDHVTVEAANIIGYQFRMCMLRVWINDELQSQIIPIEKTIYHPTAGFQQNK